jgi:uncharacterized OsmC-like protein
MITAEIFYKGNLRTSAQHVGSGNVIITDAPLDNQGKGEAFSPTDLLSTSLACCMLTIMGIAANTHQIHLEDTRVTVTKKMASDPRRVIEIEIHFWFPAIAYAEKEKKILENAALTCPVAKSLHPDIYQNVNFHYQ